MTQVTLIGIIGLIAIAACWSLAILLYRVSTTGSVARKLAVLLVVEGFVLVTAGFPEFAFAIPDSFMNRIRNWAGPLAWSTTCATPR